ncbi:DUF3955 domain-containing protein [Vibrio aquimaris]|uniref:DUF3955 domain-containing protein n=1 Tax=Vibrio aquimaris TaxID=2587862 RepID=A0A5P9CR05_9VIBR|nr:DUF3955 domain-containing protein [Vibrio aquimaris]QFT28689.1 hypothetical protein FIV01_20020 [Vibrio aquimaris]
MKKLIPNRTSMTLCIIGLLCLLTYASIGSHIDEDGILIEPFGLIPLFWVFEILAITAYVVQLIKGFNERY